MKRLEIRDELLFVKPQEMNGLKTRENSAKGGGGGVGHGDVLGEGLGGDRCLKTVLAHAWDSGQRFGFFEVNL